MLRSHTHICRRIALRGRFRPVYACSRAGELLERRLLLAAAVLDQSGGQTITPNASINASNSGTVTQSEMSVDINPTNPLNVVGFSDSSSGMDVVTSMDGGLTWTRQVINNTDDGLGGGSRFDPSIVFDADGNLFISYGFDAGARTSLVVARSTDGGTTFPFAQFRVLDTRDDFSGLPGVDKLHLAAGLEPESGNQAVYVAYTRNEDVFAGIPDQQIFVRGSRDGGNTWTSARQVSDGSLLADPGNLFADPGVGPNGELYVSWYDIESTVSDNVIYFDRDLDGLWQNGSNFGDDIEAANLNMVMFKQLGVPAQPERGIHTGPVLDVDRSGGPFNGRIYITYVDTLGLPNTNIMVARSSDEGDDWVQSTVEGPTSTEFLPWVDVDQHSGSVSILYYSTLGDPAGNDDVRPRLATSIDGGFTWSRAFVSAQTSNEAGGSTGDYLEYIGLAVHDGTAQALWATRVPCPAPCPVPSADLEAFSASASFNSSTDSNVLTIRGDPSGAATNDLINFRLSAINPAFLEVILNGTRVYTGLLATLDRINVLGGTGNDTVAVDFLNGSPVPSNDLVLFDAGNDDALIISAGNGGGALGVNGNVYTLSGSRIVSAAQTTLFLGRDGSDEVDVERTFAGRTLIIDTEGGDDIIEIAPSDENLNAIDGGITIDGGAGNNQLLIHDEQNLENDDLTLTSDTFDRTAFPLLSYSNIDLLTLYAGSGHNTINVESTAALTDTTIRGGPGLDVFHVSPTAEDLDTIDGDLTLDGQADSDQMFLHDDFDFKLNGANYFIDGFSFTRTGIASILYSTESNSLHGGAGSDSFRLWRTPSGVDWAVTGGDGDDTFEVATLDDDLDAIGGDLFLHGQEGDDRIMLSDTAEPDDLTYVITSNSFDRSFFPALTYTTTEELAIHLGPGDATVNFTSTHADTDVIVNAGAGSDRFNVAPVGRDLDTIDGNIIINGEGGGADLLAMFDRNDAIDRNHTITDTTYQRSFMAALTYGTIEQLIVNAGSGDDTFFVDSTLASTPVTLNAGGGADLIQLTEGSQDLFFIAGPIAVNGEAQSDSLVLNDQLNVFNDDFTIGATTIQRTLAGMVTYGTVESVLVHCGTGQNEIAINGTAAGAPMTINAGGGADAANLLGAPGSSLTVNGQAGDDRMEINVAVATLPTFNGGGSTDTLNVHEGPTALADGVDLGNDLSVENLNVINAQLTFNDSQHLLSISLANIARVNLAEGVERLIRTTAFSIPVGSMLNLNSGDMIVQATAESRNGVLSAITGLLRTGRNNGAWNGNGISSQAAAANAAQTTGLGVLLNDDGGGNPLFDTFAGEAVNLFAILVKYTYNGDFNFSGDVDADDYFIIDNGFLAGGTSFSVGDADLNGVVNADDYFLIDSAFAGQGDPLAAPDRAPARARHHRAG